MEPVMTVWETHEHQLSEMIGGREMREMKREFREREMVAWVSSPILRHMLFKAL